MALEVQTVSVVLRPDEVRYGLPGVFEHLGGLDGKVVGAAVHGGVPLFVELLLGLDAR